MNIFVSGGTGFVGGYVRRALLEKGHTVRLLVHRRGSGIEAGIEQVEGDVTRPETFAGTLTGCDAAINLVGIIREFPGRGVTFERLHVQATQNMVNAARDAGVRRYLQMSALGTRLNAVSAYHLSKYRAEEYVRASGLDFTIFRPSLIYGRGDQFITKLADLVKLLPLVPVIGDGTYRLQPISAEDVARCFALSLPMPETVGATFELCGSERVTYNELLDIIGRALGRNKVRKIPNPVGIMKMVVPLFQGFSLFPITMDQMTMLLEENICEGTWRTTFDLVPLNLETGIRAFIP